MTDQQLPLPPGGDACTCCESRLSLLPREFPVRAFAERLLKISGSPSLFLLTIREEEGCCCNYHVDWHVFVAVVQIARAVSSGCQ